MPPAFSFGRLLLLGLLLAFAPALWLSSTTATRQTVSIAPAALLSRVFSSFRALITSTTSTIPGAAHIPSSSPARSYNATMVRTPVYFFSHGGPNIMEETHHPAYAKLQEIGREITQKVKPKAVVVFSAHWQGYRDQIEVNTAESMGLIYDFYGFPAHYYEFKYPNKGSPELSQQILDRLEAAGIKAEGVRRGLDHGVWASFMCAFSPTDNPLNVPIVQVSLFDHEDPDKHYSLGKAVSDLRDEGIVIIVSGMAVHNLRDMYRAFGQPTPLDYAISFDDALRDAVEQPPASRQRAMAELLKRKDARRAHPTFDHLLPIYIGAGAAHEDPGKRLWTMPEGSMSWAQYRFGELAAAS